MGVQSTKTMSSSVFILFLVVFLPASSIIRAQPVPAPTLAPTSSSATPPAIGPGSESSAPGPAPGQDCLTSLANVTDCLTYVEAGNNLTKPDKNCCPSFAGLVENAPICLCQLLGNSSSFGIDIDLKKAEKLPDVCHVTTPPISLCSAVGIPVSGPAGSVAPTTPGISPDGSTPSLAPDGTISGKDSHASSIKDFSYITFIGCFLSSVLVSTLF